MCIWLKLTHDKGRNNKSPEQKKRQKPNRDFLSMFNKMARTMKEKNIGKHITNGTDEVSVVIID